MIASFSAVKHSLNVGGARFKEKENENNEKPFSNNPIYTFTYGRHGGE
jgi:hypothetical protein